MEKILEKIDNQSLELRLIAIDLLKKAIDFKDEDEKFEILNASEVLQQISKELKNMLKELKALWEAH